MELIRIQNYVHACRGGLFVYLSMTHCNIKYIIIIMVYRYKARFKLVFTLLQLICLISWLIQTTYKPCLTAAALSSILHVHVSPSMGCKPRMPEDNFV